MVSSRKSQTKDPSSPQACSALIVAELNESWLPLIYRDQVLKAPTRSYNLGPIKGHPRVSIQQTLLGVELKIGHRRLSCPDIGTARYLAIFAKVGCHKVVVPYNITKIPPVADQLESSWHRMLSRIERHAVGRPESFKTRIRRRLIDKLRAELEQFSEQAITIR